MLQALLEERFALKVRNVTQAPDTPMGDVLALVVERSNSIMDPLDQEMGWHLSTGHACVVFPGA